MILLRGLGKHDRLSKFLTEHPETAGILASVDDPLPIAESLEGSPGDYDLVGSCYAYRTHPRGSPPNGTFRRVRKKPTVTMP